MEFRAISLALGLIFTLISSRAADLKPMLASEFVHELAQAGQLRPLLNSIESRFRGVVSDPKTLEVLNQRLENFLNQKDLRAVDHFPLIPVYRAAGLRSMLGGLAREGDRAQVADKKFNGSLESLMGGPCTEKAVGPKQVLAGFADLTEGHDVDSSMSKCEIHQSIKLAGVLNALVKSNGSEVSYEGIHAQSVQSLFEILIKSGHMIEMRNDRTYANFFAYNWKGRPVIWPVWADTGYRTLEGEPIRIPVGHSQHLWKISGPIVNAKVAYYLGTAGVGFFAQVNARPAWTGSRAYYAVSSKTPTGEAVILRAADFAGRYFRRILIESKTLAKGMPANGYGYLGVCNDSTAALEAASWSDLSSGGISISTYPIMRDAGLEQISHRRDGLDDILAALPKDASSLGERRDVLSRVLKMFPFKNTNDSAIHDESLRRQMKSIAAELSAGALKP